MSTKDDITVSDEDFDAFLNREGGLAQLLKQMPQTEPPAQLDEAVLAAAKAELERAPAIPAVNKIAANDAKIPEGKPYGSSWGRHWRVPLGVAASLLVTVQLVRMEMFDERTNPNAPALLAEKVQDVEVKVIAPPSPPSADMAPPPMIVGDAVMPPAPAKAAVAPRMPVAELASPPDAAAVVPQPAPAVPAMVAPEVAPAPKAAPVEVAPEPMPQVAQAPAAAPLDRVRPMEEIAPAAPTPIADARAPAPAPAAVASAPERIEIYSARAQAREEVVSAPTATPAPAPMPKPVQAPALSSGFSAPAPAPALAYAPAPAIIPPPASPVVARRAPVNAMPAAPVAELKSSDAASRGDSQNLAYGSSKEEHASAAFGIMEEHKFNANSRVTGGLSPSDADARLSKIAALLKAGSNQDALLEWHKFRDTYPEYKVPDALRRKINALLK